MTVSICIVEQIVHESMDKAAIKLHKMNIFPNTLPLDKHVPSTFLPVFSGTMLPNGLPVSCLPPRTAFPPIVGAPRVSLTYVHDNKKRATGGRPYYPSFLYHPTQKCHCLPSRRFATPDCHSLRPRPPPFSPPQTRFPGKRYHEQTASPNKARGSWRSESQSC